jgi:hypothetical protein
MELDNKCTVGVPRNGTFCGSTWCSEAILDAIIVLYGASATKLQTAADRYYTERKTASMTVLDTKVVGAAVVIRLHYRSDIVRHSTVAFVSFSR